MSNYYNRQWRLPNNENKDKVDNYSLSSSASNDAINFNYTDEFMSGQNPWTLSLWILWTSQPVTYKAYFFKGQLTSRSMVALYGDSAAIKFMCQGDDFFIPTFQTPSSVTVNKWYNLTITYDGNLTIKAYVDNTLDVTHTLGSPLDIGGGSKTNYFQLFQYNGSTIYGPTNARLSSVSIFNYELSSSQVTTLYGDSTNGVGNPISLNPKPVAMYNLGDKSVFNSSSYLIPNDSIKDYVFKMDSGGGDVITSNINQSNTGGKFTVSIWVKNESQLFQFNHGGSNRGGFGLTGSFRPLVYLANNYWQYFATQSASSKWQHWVIFVDTTNITNSKLWIDGVSIGQSTSSTGGSANSFTSGFKLYQYSSGSSLGLVSNMMYFTDYEIDQTNVNVLYNNGAPITSTSGLSTTPDHWWKLNSTDIYNASNWTITDHVGSSDGTSSGMNQSVLVQSDLSFTSGYSPYALDFDATDDFITVGGASGIATTDSSSLSIWFKTTTTSSFKGLFGMDTTSLSFYSSIISTKSSGGVKIQVYLNGYKLVSPAINDGNWHNLVLTYDHSASLFKAYTDGTETYSLTYSQASTGMNLKYIGGTYQNLYKWDGSLSNASLWNAALTSSQVSEIYNEGVPQNLLNHSAVSSLVSWWQLGSNSSWVNPDWTVLDEKGTNNGTSSNMGEDAIVDGVGSYANGTSSGMGGDEVVGDAPYSTANSLSVNMDVEDRVNDTPS